MIRTNADFFLSLQRPAICGVSFCRLSVGPYSSSCFSRRQECQKMWQINYGFNVILLNWLGPTTMSVFPFFFAKKSVVPTSSSWRGPYQDGKFFCNMNCQAGLHLSHHLNVRKKCPAFIFCVSVSLSLLRQRFLHKTSGVCGSQISVKCSLLSLKNVVLKVQFFPWIKRLGTEKEKQQGVPPKNATVLDEFYSHILGLLVPHNGSHNTHVKRRNDLTHRQLWWGASLP